MTDVEEQKRSRISERTNTTNNTTTTRRRPASDRTSPSSGPSSTHQSASTTAAVSSRFISGSIGSLVTALAVTPLEVVKVHLQNVKHSPTPISAVSIPPNVSPCPKGCGIFVLNNGLFDCTLPKSCVPYFDQYGNYKKDALVLVESTAAPSKSIKNATTTTHQRQRPTTNLGTLSIIRKIFVRDGFRGIYAGLAPTLVMGVPSTALYYSVYDEIVDRARRNNNNKHIRLPDSADPWIPLVAGSSARLLSTLVTAPLELIRTKQASMVGEGREVSRGMMAEFQSIVRSEGCGALYKGLGPTLWRDVPFSGIYWLCLEQLRGLYGPIMEGEAPSTSLQKSGTTFLSGATAGMVAAACTTPFDVVKTRQQAVASVETAAAHHHHEIACNHDGHVVYRAAAPTAEVGAGRSASVFAHMRSIYETEGYRGLWRGNQTRMIKVAPSCAIMISVYEVGKRMLEPSST